MTAAPRTTAAPLGSALVVEDDPVVAMAVAEALRAGGADPVETCSSIACAMATFERLQPALIVLDVHLADRSDGWAFAELLEQIGPRPPQVIFATGTPEDIPAEIAALGSVLAKPFTAEELLETVRRARRGTSLMARLRGALSSDRS